MWHSIDLDTCPIGTSASSRGTASPDSRVDEPRPAQASQTGLGGSDGSQLDAALALLLNNDGGLRGYDGDADAWLPVPAIDFFDSAPAFDWSAVTMQPDLDFTVPDAAGRIAPPVPEPDRLNVANSVQSGLTSTTVAADEPSPAAKATQSAFSLSPSSKSPSTSPGSFAVPHPRPLSRRAVSSTPVTSSAHRTVPSSIQPSSSSSSSSPAHRSPPSSNPSPFFAPAFPLHTSSALRHSSSAPTLASVDFDPTGILASLELISPTPSSVDHPSVHSTPRTTPPSSTSLTSPATLPSLPLHLRRPSAVSAPLEPAPNEEDESASGSSYYDEEDEAEQAELDQQQPQQEQQQQQQQKDQGEAKPKEKRRRRKRPNMFKCQLDPNCKAEFSRAEHLARHERKHTKEKPFICHCTKAFSRLDNWRQHKNSVHKDETMENQRTEDRLMGVHKTIQRRNNANKQAYMSGETLAISAPPDAIPGSSTGGGIDAVAPLPAPTQQPTFAGVHQHHHPQLSIATSGSDYDNPYGSPSRYYHNRGSSGAYGYWPSAGEEASNYSAGSAPADSPTYGLAETSGRAYVALSPTGTSFAQSASSGPGPSPYSGYGPVLSMPPAAFSPGNASSYANQTYNQTYQSQGPYRPQPPSQRSSANSSARSGHSTVDAHGNNASPSPSGGRAIQLPSLSSSVSSSGGSQEAEIARQEILRARALAAVLNKPIEEIEREASFFPGHGVDYDGSRPPSATQLSHSLAALTSNDPMTTSGQGEYGAHARVSPPSPLRPLIDPAVTLGLPAQPTYISAPGTPGDRYGSFHRPAPHHAYPPFATPPLSGPDTTSYRLPARPKSSNDMRSAVVLASAVAAHHAAVGGDTFNPIDMAHSASSSSTLASSPSYSFNPHPHPFASSGVHHQGGGMAGGPSSSVPASPVVSYLMPPFLHHAGAPRHLESPNLPSTPRMESASSVATRGSVMPVSHSPLLGGPVTGGASAAAGVMMMGGGSASSTPVIESSAMMMGQTVERAPSPGKRRREDEVDVPRMAITKRVAY